MCIYQANNRRFILDDGRIAEISELDHKFLIAISDEEITPVKVIAKYVFGCSSNRYIEKLKVLKRRLNRFIQIQKIDRLAGVGYKLKTKILYM